MNEQSADIAVVQMMQLELERKDFQHQIEKLKFEKEIMRLKFDNQNLSYENESLKKKENSEDKIKESIEMKEKVEKLDKNVERLDVNVKSLKIENQKLKEISEELKKKIEELEENSEMSNEKLKGKSQPSNQSNPFQKNKLVTKIERMTEGVSRYIEDIEPKTKVYDSYVQWYDDITKRMDNEIVYRSAKYLFLRRLGDLEYNLVIGFISKSPNYAASADFNAYTFKEGWTHKNTRLVCILHPEHPDQFIELDFDGGLRDQDENEYGHLWKVDLKKFLESRHDGGKRFDNRQVYSIILCCIKH